MQEVEVIMDTVMPHLITYGLDALGAILILIAGWIVSKWLSARVYHVASKSGKIDKTIVLILRQIVRISILIITVLAVLHQFGVQTTSIIAVLGAATLAIGLALQGTLSNVAAGTMLLIFRPFKVDDFVNVGGNMGSVKEIGLFTTRMHTVDGILVIVPNARIWGSEITNFSHNPTRRLEITFGISYTDDMDKAMGLIREVFDADERILPDPAPIIVVNELGDSSVDIMTRVWSKTADFWQLKWDLTKKVKESFDANGISIPFPQRDVHLYTTNGKD